MALGGSEEVCPILKKSVVILDLGFNVSQNTHIYTGKKKRKKQSGGREF